MTSGDASLSSSAGGGPVGVALLMQMDLDELYAGYEKLREDHRRLTDSLNAAKGAGNSVKEKSFAELVKAVVVIARSYRTELERRSAAAGPQKEEGNGNGVGASGAARAAANGSGGPLHQQQMRPSPPAPQQALGPGGGAAGRHAAPGQQAKAHAAGPAGPGRGEVPAETPIRAFMEQFAGWTGRGAEEVRAVADALQKEWVETAGELRVMPPDAWLRSVPRPMLPDLRAALQLPPLDQHWPPQRAG